MKKWLKKNVFNILLAVVVLTVMGLVSTWELESEQADATTVKAIDTTYAEEAADEATKEPVEEPVAEKPEPTVQTLIIQSAKDYGIDSNLALAIAKLETGHFTSDAYTQCNNVGGLLTADGICKYDSLEDGIDSFMKTLHNIGTEDIDALAQTYCTHNPSGWAEKVRGLM